MAEMRSVIAWIGRSGKRIAITVLGFTLVAVGLAMLVLPGPGLLVVIAGLAVLASEYAWARRVLDETKSRARSATDRFRRKNKQ